MLSIRVWLAMVSCMGVLLPGSREARGLQGCAAAVASHPRSDPGRDGHAAESAVPEGLAASDWASIRDLYEAGQRAALPVGDGHEARNHAQQWRTHFDGRGFTTTPDAGGWTWGLELQSYGFPGGERGMEGRARMRAEGSRVAYEWDDTLEEWYVNERRGLEHGYTVREPPRQASETEGPLTFTLAVRGGLRPDVLENGRGARFVDQGGTSVLTYAGLVVLDADGRELAARLEVVAAGLRILVDEREARYPLTIDPIAQQAYLKASNTESGDEFGTSVSVSGDTVVVGAVREDSSATGVNGGESDNGAFESGAAYVFVRSGMTWTQQAYLKASNTDDLDFFGTSVSISGDTLVVGAYTEDSSATGVNGDENDEGASDSGAAYVFVRSGTTWTQEAYLKASNTDADDYFGVSVSVSGDTLVVGAWGEDSSTTGVNGDENDEGASDSGAAYVFVRNGTTWTQQAYLKASNTGVEDIFGWSVSVSGDTVVVGALGEASSTTGVNGDESDNGASYSGAAYVFVRNGTTWTQRAYLKASNTGVDDEFGSPVSVSGDTVVVGARFEDSNATGVNGDDSDNSASNSGAAYVFVRSGTTWTQQAYLKASNTDAADLFGFSVSVSGNTVVVGALQEASSATGVNGDQDDDSVFGAGAAYVFERGGTTWTQQAYLKASNTDIDSFGWSVSISGDTVVVATGHESSSATGVNGDESNNDAPNSGAAYTFTLSTAWTGATDSDWTDASNWSNGVPDPIVDAIVPDAATTPNDPVISVSGQTCDTLVIETGGTLDISAGMDSLGVSGGAIVEGPITGTGELVFEAAGTLTGNSTIDPDVRAEADLFIEGGPLTLAGNLEGNASVSVAAFATIDVGGSVDVAGDLSIEGDLGVGDSVTVGATLFSSSGSQLEVGGPTPGACISAGQVCLHGDVVTSCSLSVERLVADSTEFEIENGWPADISVDVAGTVTLLTSQLSIGGDLDLIEGTFAVGVSGSIAAESIVVEDGAVLDITGFQLLVPAPASITVQSGGKLNIGAGGVLLLESNTLTIESGGTLCLDGAASNHAELSGYQSSRYTLALNSGSTLAAKNFTFQQMSASGIVVGSGVTIAAPPLDLRGGRFDLPDTNGVLIDIVRSVPTQLRYLRFDNSLSATGVTSVRTSLASSVLTLVNWSGDLAPDATTAETFDDDPGESSPPERIVFAPPEASDVQGFTVAWNVGFVRTTWSTADEVDSDAFVVRRTTEPPTVYTTVGETPSVGPGSYELRDYDYRAFEATRYRLYERLTHGALRLIDEVQLPASGIVTGPASGTPAPPMLSPAPIVVGAGGSYPDVRSALRGLARVHREAPVTLVLASGWHASFELGRGLGFDLRLVARPGAVVDSLQAPMRIAGLAAHRSVELVGLVVDARRALHPALVVEDAQGVVLMQGVELQGSASGPALQLANARAVAMQGGAVEGELLLERRSRATASGVTVRTFELVGGSVLETRGMGAEEPGWSPAVPGPGGSPADPGPRWSVALRRRIEPGSRWIEHAAAPRLTVDNHGATLEADCSGIAWLGVAPRLGFEARSRECIEGVLLLDPTSYSAAGPLRLMKDGRASWSLGPLPAGECVHVQGLVLDTASGRVCLTDVVRIER